MIGRLTGTISYTDTSHIVLDVHGVGYEVFMTPDSIHLLDPETPHTIWIHHVIREDASQLYGFVTFEDRHIFRLLTSVSGIGPKTALSILSNVATDALRTAIQTGQGAHLVKVGGIGKKTVDKILLELAGKLGANIQDHGTITSDADALEALKSLGYTTIEARDVLRALPKSITDTQTKIREALKHIGKRHS